MLLHYKQMPVVIAIVLLATWTCLAGDGEPCRHCGRLCECQPVCRLVCEMKEVTKTTWGCKCEDVCVPGPSQRCFSDCNCGHCQDCRAHAWIPTAAYLKTRKVPVKQVEKMMKPSYRLVVEYLYPACQT